MPDLKSELSKVLNEWDKTEQPKEDPMPKKIFSVTNNASRDTFNFVRDNPGLRVSEIKAQLSTHKANTVSTLVYQMAIAGLIRKDANTGAFYAIQDEFTPFNINKIRQKVKHAKAEVVKPVASPKVEIEKVELTSRPRPWRPEDTVDTLTLGQAIAVHKHLKQLFGA